MSKSPEVQHIDDYYGSHLNHRNVKLSSNFSTDIDFPSNGNYSKAEFEDGGLTVDHHFDALESSSTLQAVGRVLYGVSNLPSYDTYVWSGKMQATWTDEAGTY